MQVQSLAPNSGLKDLALLQLWCRCNCGSDLTPGLAKKMKTNQKTQVELKL